MAGFRKKVKIIAILLLITTVIIFICGYFNSTIRPIVYTYCDALMSSGTIECINKSSCEVIESYQYIDFVTVDKDVEGNIVLMKTNAGVINAFTRSLALRCEAFLKETENMTLSIPWGAFTGSILMSGHGKKVNIDIIAKPSVLCELYSSFQSFGINQTKHGIYVRIDVTYNTILPISSHCVKISNSILVAESIIIGKIPDTYIGSSNNTEYLDLVP